MTPSPELSAQRAPHAELWRLLQRERALIALYDRATRKSLASWSARLYALFVFIGYALTLSLSRGADRRALIHQLVQAALVALSWGVGAPAALSAARVLAPHAGLDSAAALATQRGFSPASQARASVLATALRIARWVGLPALLLVLLGVLRGARAAWALAVAPAVVVYASVLGLGCALLAHLSAQLSPRHGRALLCALVLVPLLISQAYPLVPNVPELFAGVLDRLLGAGARGT